MYTDSQMFGRTKKAEEMARELKFEGLNSPHAVSETFEKAIKFDLGDIQKDKDAQIKHRHLKGEPLNYH